MIDGTFPPVLEQGRPRAVRMSIYCWIGVVLWSVVFFIPTALVIYVAGEQGYKEYVLNNYGVETIGEIIRLYNENHKGNISYFAEYSYSCINKNTQKYDKYSANEQIGLVAQSTLHVGDGIKVMCDPYNGTISSIPFDFIKKEYNPVGKIGHVLLISLIVCGVPYAVFMYRLLKKFRRERAILENGNLAIATVVGKREYYVKGNVKATAIVYEFLDGEGRRVSGSRDDFPSGKFSDRQPIVYDPADSERHVLYPAQYAICVER